MNRRLFVKSSGLSAVITFFASKFSAKEKHILYGDGIHDDTKAFQALINGKKVFWSDGEIADLMDMRGDLFIRGTIQFRGDIDIATKPKGRVNFICETVSGLPQLKLKGGELCVVGKWHFVAPSTQPQ